MQVLEGPVDCLMFNLVERDMVPAGKFVIATDIPSLLVSELFETREAAEQAIGELEAALVECPF